MPTLIPFEINCLCIGFPAEIPEEVEWVEYVGTVFATCSAHALEIYRDYDASLGQDSIYGYFTWLALPTSPVFLI